MTRSFFIPIPGLGRSLEIPDVIYGPTLNYPGTVRKSKREKAHERKRLAKLRRKQGR